MRFSIQGKLILTMILLLMVVLSLRTFLEIYSIRTEKEAGFRELLMRSADLFRYSLEAEEDYAVTMAQVIAGEPSFVNALKNNNSDKSELLMRTQMAPFGMFELIVTDKDGIIIVDTSRSSKKGMSIFTDNAFAGFEQVLQGNPIKSLVIRRKQIFVQGGVPIFYKNEQIGACFSYGLIDKSFNDRIKALSGSDNLFFLEDQVLHSTLNQTTQPSKMVHKETLVIEEVFRNPKGYFKTIPGEKEPFIGLYFPLPATTTFPLKRLWFGVGVYSTELQTAISNAIRIGMTTGISALLLGILCAVILAKTISRPISLLQKQIEHLKHGEYPSFPVFSARDEIGYLASAFIEMTDVLKKREQELLERTMELSNQKLEFEELAHLAAREQEKLATIMESVPDAIIAVDKNILIMGWNKGAEELTGWQKDEVMGKYLEYFLQLSLHGIENKFSATSLIKNIFETKKAEDSDVKDIFLLCRNKIKVPVHITASPIIDDKGEAIAAVAIIRNISKQKEVETLKEDFLATVTHDLATPLTVILGNAHILQVYKQSNLSQDDLKLLDNIINAGRNLGSLIKNLLNTAKLEAGRMSYQLEHFSLSRFIAETVEPFGPLASQKEITLRLQILHDLYVYADKEKLQEIISNLMINALKFTSKGGHIIVQTRKEEDKVSITITDTGKGIPNESLPFLFQKFSQVKGEKHGTGLGLYIAKKFVDDMHGAITVTSNTAKGSSFTVFMPQGDPEKAEEVLLPKSGRQSGRILVVEDDRDVAMLISLYLEREYHTVDMVHSAQEALQMVHRNTYDIITIDYNLPDMNGDNLALTLKGDPKFEKIPRILITGQSAIVYVPKTVLLYNRILTKPIQPEVLKNAVREVLISLTTQEPATESETLNALKNEPNPLDSHPNKEYQQGID